MNMYARDAGFLSYRVFWNRGRKNCLSTKTFKKGPVSVYRLGVEGCGDTECGGLTGRQ